MTKYVFFNLEHEHQFLMDGTGEQARQIINTAAGQLYYRELKGKKLIVATGLRKGLEGPEILTPGMMDQFHMKETHAASPEVALK